MNCVKKVALIVEGLGDRKAFPSLVTKAAGLANQQIYVRKVIEAGEWSKLSRVGVLEKYCMLASIDTTIDHIIVALDLDDACVKSVMDDVRDRLLCLNNSLRCPVSISFAIREFECWFLEALPSIKAASSDISWTDYEPPKDPAQVRDAKGAFAAQLGANYRPSIDQEKFSKRLDVMALSRVSRSFRKFVKEVTGLSYDELNALIA